MDDQNPLARALADIAQCERNSRLSRTVLQAHKKLINKLLHKLAGADDVSVYADAVCVNLSCNLTQLDGFKAPRLMRALAEFAGDEWTAKTYDSAGSLNRDFHFTMPSPLRGTIEGTDPDYLSVKVRISAYVRSDSPTCRKVLIGKKRVSTVEKQYRIECN